MSPRSWQREKKNRARTHGARSTRCVKGSINQLKGRVVIVSQCTLLKSLCVIYVSPLCVRACRCVFECTVRCFARYFRAAAVRSLVRPSNVSPVLLDYPIYLQHQEGDTPLCLLNFWLHCVQLLRAATESDWVDSTFFSFFLFPKPASNYAFGPLTMQGDSVFSLPLFGTSAPEESVGNGVPGLSVLRLASDGERCRGEDDDRIRQTATSGEAAPEGETKHYSVRATGGASHCPAQTPRGTRQTGWHPWTRKQFTNQRSRLWNSELCRYK